MPNVYWLAFGFLDFAKVSQETKTEFGEVLLRIFDTLFALMFVPVVVGQLVKISGFLESFLRQIMCQFHI